MKHTQLASRYAKALFELASENGQQDKVFAELRQFKALIEKDPAIKEFVLSPLIKAEDKAATLAKAISDEALTDATKNFLLVLARKNRLGIFDEITDAFQAQSDLAHGVVRGQVRSATVLAPEERGRIEDIVAKATQKQVILNYKEDPSVIGGLIAEVGTFTFDDTLSSHLRRMKEDINRRTH